MEKGILIFAIVFISILILNFAIINLAFLPEVKKNKIRKVFWYLYGLLFVISGMVNFFDKEKFSFIFSIQILLGIVTIILTFLGKMETKKP